MAAKKKGGPKKATKGKNGCLKNNGKLKKGFKWAKGRKGYCQPVAAKKAAKKGGKKGGAKKGGSRKKAAPKAAAHKAIPALPESVTKAILSAPSAAEKYAQRDLYTADELKLMGLGRYRRR